MACTTNFEGQYGDCNTGGAQPGIHSFSAPGKLVPGTFGQCGYSWQVMRYADGSHYPISFANGTLVYSYVDCQGIPTESGYDCINAGCVGKSLYQTPGKYATLAACQSACAKDSNCTGECVDPAEIAQLNQAINQLKSKYCG